MTISAVYLALFGSPHVTYANCSYEPDQCFDEELCGYATKGDYWTQYTWETRQQYSKHVIEAKRRGLSCQVETVTVWGCHNDPKLCGENNLCGKSTVGGPSNKRWDTSTAWKAHVAEAKSRGLSCDVGNVEKQPAKTCNTDPTLCTVVQLCRKASKHNISGKKVWKTTGEATKYVAEAKRNGVACGVQSVVAQPAPKPRDNKTYEVSSGSGFYVSEAGHIVTNHHVIDGCKSMKIQSTGKVWNTTIIANDPQNDLALIKVDKKPAHVFALSAETPFPLQDIIVAGFPFGDSFSSALKFTQGIISAGMGLGNNYSQIQIDAALQPGNSGGPIMDEYGNIVGVAVAKLSLKKIVDEYGVVPENTNFGVKASVVRNLMEGNRVPLKKPNYETVRKPKLSRMATDGTVHLTCWMTKAQIKEIIKRKDNRKVLFSQFETE